MKGQRFKEEMMQQNILSLTKVRDVAVSIPTVRGSLLSHLATFSPNVFLTLLVLHGYQWRMAGTMADLENFSLLNIIIAERNPIILLVVCYLDSNLN